MKGAFQKIFSDSPMILHKLSKITQKIFVRDKKVKLMAFQWPFWPLKGCFLELFGVSLILPSLCFWFTLARTRSGPVTLEMDHPEKPTPSGFRA